MLELARGADGLHHLLQRSQMWCFRPRPCSFPGQETKGSCLLKRTGADRTAGKIADYRKAALWYLDDAPRATLVIESTSKEDAADLFDIIYRSLDVKPEEDEPMMNVLVLYEADRWVVFVFPREKHRPACYTAEGEANLLSSPASVDLGGVFITPVEKDFLKITAEDVDADIK